MNEQETMTMTQPDTTGQTGNSPEGHQKMIGETIEETIDAAQLMDEEDAPSADDAPPWDTDDDGEIHADGGEIHADDDEAYGESSEAGEHDEATPDEAPSADAPPDEAQCREALRSLLESGFTMEEIRAFSQDAASQAAIAAGMSIARAATGFLRRQSARPAASAKRGVPTVRTASAGERSEGSIIERMSDEQFRAFSRRAMEATLAGRRVRVD